MAHSTKLTPEPTNHNFSWFLVSREKNLDGKCGLLILIHSAAEFLEPGRVVMSIVLSILSSFLAQLMTLGEERTQALEETNLILACSSLWSWACSSLLCALDSLSVKWGAWAPNIPFLRSFRPVIHSLYLRSSQSFYQGDQVKWGVLGFKALHPDFQALSLCRTGKRTEKDSVTRAGQLLRGSDAVTVSPN